MIRPAPATIAEVARRAGVSKGTASRILNGKNKENRPSIARRAQHVRNVAAELGYRPNAAARSIGTGRFNAVAFITCSDIGADYFPRLLLHGIHAGLQDLGYRLVVSEVSAEALRDVEYVPHMLREQTVDALLVYPNPRFGEHIIPYFEQQPQPTIWMNLALEHNAAYPDEASGAALAIDYLIERGRRRLGYFGHLENPWGGHFSEVARRDGWINAMKARRLSPRRTRLYRYDDGITSSRDAAKLFLKAFEDVNGVLCYEQEEAISLQMAAMELGIRVPDDLLITAFHEGEVRATTGALVPTVIVPFAEVGREAVRMLQAMLDSGPARVPSRVIEYAEIRE